MKLTLTLLALLALPLMAAPETALEITSPDFSNGGDIPSRFTCQGRNDNPGLRFNNIPENAKSLALILDDPDAPRGTFNHWLVWNITTDTKEFTTGSTPQGIATGTNDAGKTGYFGPCPPSGVHRYYFRLYALDKTLDLPKTTKRGALDKALKGHILAQATLMGRYGKNAAGGTGGGSK
jgi:hypothetical protein